MFRKTNVFYKRTLQWLPSAKDNVHVFIYTKIKTKLLNVFIYKSSDTFQKSRQFTLRFYIQRLRHFTLRNFLWNLWSWHLYTKCMTLCVTWRFNIQKSRYFAKSKTICVMFLYTKIRTLCVMRFFIEFLKLVEGGKDFNMKMTIQFSLHLYMQKTCTLRYFLLFKNPDNFRYIFICKKPCTLHYICIYIIYHIVLISNYKRTYDQSNQSNQIEK